MEQDWKAITNELYSKIRPLGGTLYSRIDYYFPYRKKIENIWIEFEMNDFVYNDPFYGEQKSNAPFKTSIELTDYTSSLALMSIYDLQGKTIECGKEDPTGAFSNSLHFTVPKLQFGDIQNLEVDITLEYSLTNSDSYGMMSGNITDHTRIKGTISTRLKIKELSIVCRNDQSLLEIAKSLDEKVYDIENIRLATGLNSSSEHSKCFYVSYQ